MEIISSVFYFVVVLGILVFVHEFGHFLMARLSGMRVEVFALGMGFRLFGWNKKNGFTFGNLPSDLDLDEHTDYRISAFPIGGYCKISGMVDESFDTQTVSQAPKPYEFRSKNAFKKSITIAGGVLFNILLAILLFSIITYKSGEVDFKTTKISFVAENSIGEKIGFLAGDEIKSINNTKVTTWGSFINLLALDNLGENKKILLLRDGVETNINANGKEIIKMLSSNTPLGLEHEDSKTVILNVQAGSLAEGAGLKQNDTIISVNGIKIGSLQEFIAQLKSNKQKKISLEWNSNNSFHSKDIQLDASGTIGVQITQAYTGEILHKNFEISEALVAGTKQTFSTFSTIVSSIKQIIVGNIEFKKAIGGPVMIAQQASQFADRGFLSFMSFTAMLSVSLALINILPLPALDGGHIVIIIIEAIIRRELPLKIKLAIQQAGMFLLLGLMLYVIVNDILKLV